MLSKQLEDLENFYNQTKQYTTDPNKISILIKQQEIKDLMKENHENLKKYMKGKKEEITYDIEDIYEKLKNYEYDEETKEI